MQPSAVTKIYKNTSKKTLNILGVGELKPGEQVSVTTDNHAPVVLENYPGLVDVEAEEQKKKESKK
jgi:hypothetical protein